MGASKCSTDTGLAIGKNVPFHAKVTLIPPSDLSSSQSFGLCRCSWCNRTLTQEVIYLGQDLIRQFTLFRKVKVQNNYFSS